MENSVDRSSGNNVDQGNVRIGRDYVTNQQPPSYSRLHMLMHGVQTIIMMAMLAMLAAIIVFLRNHDNNVASINAHTSITSRLEAAEEKEFILSYLFDLYGKTRTDGNHCPIPENNQSDTAGNGLGGGDNDIRRTVKRGSSGEQRLDETRREIIKYLQR